MAVLPCPECKHKHSKIYDSRSSGEVLPHIRRRRKCMSCGHCFTTREIIAEVDELYGFVEVE